MTRVLRWSFGGIVTLGLVLGSVAGRAAGPEAGINVNVINPTTNPVPVSIQGTGSITGAVTVTNPATSPVPVTGTVAISGTPSVTGTVAISGTPSVTITNSPATTSSDRTVLVASGDVTASSQFNQVFQTDLSAYKTVRLIITCFEAGCSNLTGRVFEVTGSSSMQVDGFPLPPQLLTALVRYYDLPGTFVSFDVVNANTALSPKFRFVLLGRRN